MGEARTGPERSSSAAPGSPGRRPGPDHVTPLDLRGPATLRGMVSRGRSAGSLLSRLVLAVLVLALVLVGASFVPGVIGEQVKQALAAVNPFTSTTTDRTGAPVLISLQELSEFRAATAYLEVVVDVENDTGFVPDFISGERVIYVGKGNVDAFVDFSGLDEDRVVVSEDGQRVTVSLPAPQVDEPDLDLEESYVADADAGLIERFSGSELEREAQLDAAARLGQVAAEGDLLELARSSTTDTLEALLGSLGFAEVVVEFEA